MEELDASTSRAVFAADAGVMMLGLLAIELLHLGLVEQGRQRIEAALRAGPRVARAGASPGRVLAGGPVRGPRWATRSAWRTRPSGWRDCRRNTTGPRARRPRSGSAAGPRRISATRAPAIASSARATSR